MKKKILLQLFLIILIIIVCTVFFQVYFKGSIDTKTMSENNVNIGKDDDNQETANLLDNFKYTVEDKDGNQYKIESKRAKINLDEPELVFMYTVTGTMNSKNSSDINIYAQNGLFNKMTYETNFNSDVLVKYDDHIIKSDKLDFFFKKNLAIITNNISYKNLNTSLQADKIEIDLISKNTKIFMHNEANKVKIININ